MSEKTEKLVHIIMPDLLNYLEMVESGEIIEKRIEKSISREQKEENEEKWKILQKNKNFLQYFLILC